jgi:hypothetical protein
MKLGAYGQDKTNLLVGNKHPGREARAGAVLEPPLRMLVAGKIGGG